MVNAEITCNVDGERKVFVKIFVDHCQGNGWGFGSDSVKPDIQMIGKHNVRIFDPIGWIWGRIDIWNGIIEKEEQKEKQK